MSADVFAALVLALILTGALLWCGLLLIVRSAVGRTGYGNKSQAPRSR